MCLRVTGHFFAAHLSHGLCLLLAAEVFRLIPSCRAVAWVLRRSLARLALKGLVVVYTIYRATPYWIWLP